MSCVFLRTRDTGKDCCGSISNLLSVNYNRDIPVIRNDQIPNTSFYNVVIRWGCTSNINANIIINSARAIHISNMKKEFRRALRNNAIDIPQSFFSKEEIIAHVKETGRNIFPLVGREQYHSQGKNFLVINSIGELIQDYRSAYWSEYIDKDKEFRIFTFFGRIILVAEKVPTEKGRTEFAWNHALGNASFENVRWKDWPLRVCLEALETSKINKIDFSGVDIMTKEDNIYVLEANSAPSLLSQYRQETFAKAFNWLCNKIELTGNKPEHFSIPEYIESYKDIIHSCLLRE